jgi:hypothetical protein
MEAPNAAGEAAKTSGNAKVKALHALNRRAQLF